MTLEGYTCWDGDNPSHMGFLLPRSQLLFSPLGAEDELELFLSWYLRGT